MSTVCLSFAKNRTTKLSQSSSIKAKINVSCSIPSKLTGICSTKANNSSDVPRFAKIAAQVSVKAFHNASMNLKELSEKPETNIKARFRLSNNATTKLFGSPLLKINSLDKFYTSKVIDTSKYNQKLYPIKDIIIEQNNSFFINKDLNTNNLYSYIDEGVFVGDYIRHGSSGSRIISDDNSSYIQPSSVFTKGKFRYKCEITPPVADIKDSILGLRIFAPLSDSFSDIPPQYTISNISLQDPSGNLISKYKDITLRGDGKFATYITHPEVNPASGYSWYSGYPIFGLPSGYTLNMDFDIDCLDDPFSEGFSKGYEDTCKIEILQTSGYVNDYLSYAGSPLSTQNQGFNLNPNNSIRISAIEICSSGASSFIKDHYIPFHTEVKATGQRNIRTIYPSEVLSSGYNLNVFPQVISSWKTSVDDTNTYAFNDYESNLNYLTSKLQDDTSYNFITLHENSSLIDSGRLTLKFSHKPPPFVVSYSDGAFSFGSETDAFDTAELQYISEEDNYFTIDKIELCVVAKKANGSNNYPIDVIGYSDDGLLNITSRKNAFLQNSVDESTHIVGIINSISGLNNINDLGISTNPLSTKNQFFESQEITNPAGDHYIINNTPLVDSTIFKKYTIPLDIYEDSVTLGKSRAYNISPMFENLFIDLYPIPVGASISTAYLLITYKPSNALGLHTFGQSQSDELVLRKVNLLPSTSSGTKIIHNASGSYLSTLPHAYSSSSSGVTSNYSRRWRGVDSSVVWGPFDPERFSPDFYNPPSDHPFTYGHFAFNNIALDKSKINPEIVPNLDNSYSLTWGGSSSDKIIEQNIGYRINGSSNFNEPTEYRTIDWTRTTSKKNILINIDDAFDKFISIGSNNQTLSIPSSPAGSGFNYNNGFAVYLRFSPQITAIGTNYNLFNSGTIFSIGSGNIFGLHYSGGCLVATAKHSSGQIAIFDNNHYTSYHYPMSVLLTYNDNNSKKLKLYTDLQSNNNLLKSSSQTFDPIISSSKTFEAGNSNYFNSIPILVHEIGLSESYCNIVESNAKRLYKEITAQKFFDGISPRSNENYKLYEFIDDDTDKWLIGDYNYGHFSADFFRMTKRDGNDYIVHNLKHNGSGYLQLNNLIPPPSSVNLDEVAYHTQIENDFIRFSLSDVYNNFVFNNSRVSKSLPRGYNFSEKSIYVESIIEHETLNNLVWKNKKVGPKFIVSLYTTRKDDINRPSTKNLGLINRSIHYLEPSGNIHKLISTFNYKDILDRSEAWSDFNYQELISEFDHKYFSYDINDMFLQYDIVYPSGSAFESSIKIHSANVKLQDAVLKKDNIAQSINIVSNAEKKALNNINLHTAGLAPIYASVNLTIDGTPMPSSTSSTNLFVTSAFIDNETLNLHCLNIGRISSFNNNLFGSVAQSDEIFTPELGLVTLANEKFDYQIMPIFTHVVESYPSLSQNISLFTNNKALESVTNSVNIVTYSRNALENRYPSANMSLTTVGLKELVLSTNSFNLYINSTGLYKPAESSIGLFTINYPAFNQQVDKQGVIMWDSNNIGKSITSLDNNKAFLEANDEIRGVDIICYGGCK